MANEKDYLTDYYKDFMSYPKKITMGHSAFIDLKEEDKAVISSLKKDFTRYIYSKFH